MRLKSGLCWHLKLRLLFREKIMRATMWNHHLGRAGNMVNFTCLWPVVKMHRHYSKQICPIPGMTSFPFFFLHVWHTVNKDGCDQFSPPYNMAPPIKCWNVFPTFRIWSVFTALTSKMWKKGSGPVLGLILRVSAFSLEEASYHVRNLATWNYHAMRKPMFVSNITLWRTEEFSCQCTEASDIWVRSSCAN